MHLSKVLAINSWILLVELDSTIYGLYPHPSKYFINSSSGILANIVGFAILYPFKWRIGNTTPSVCGLIILFICQDAANGPVSASPSPTTHVAIKSGLSKTAPNAWAKQYPNSPPSLIEPGVSGATWKTKLFE